MANLRYSASPGSGQRHDAPFLNRYYVLILVLSVLGMAVYLYPAKQLIQAQSNERYLSEANYYYSLMILKHHYHVNITPDILNQQPQSAIQTLQTLAQKTQSIHEAWLAYITLRSIALTNAHKALQAQALTAIKSYYPVFENSPDISINQLKILAQDALAMDLSGQASIFFETLLTREPNQSIQVYGQAIKAAVWSKHYQKAADLAFKAEHQAPQLEDKRYFFFLGLDALLENEKYDLAMQAALKNIEPLKQDVQTYQLLADYALRAGYPQLAQEFMLHLLKLQGISRSANPK